MAQPQEFPFNIMDVAELLHLHIRRRQADSVYADCPICGDKRGKMNINFAKNLWRCNYCNEGGGMLSLYGKVYGISNSEAYREICDTLQNGLTVPEYTAKVLPEQTAIEQSVLASPQEIHQTFSMLLELLTLTPQHRKHLREVRGLTDEQIERLGYKSTPPFYLCRSLAQKLRSRGCKVEGVPGFYVGKDDKWTVNFNSVTAGIIIPAKGIDGMIRGAQIRLDTPIREQESDPDKSGTKYLWLSSASKKRGVSSGSPVHFVGDPFARVVYVTEGLLKADVAHFLMDRSFAATAGANNVNKLDTLGVDKVYCLWVPEETGALTIETSNFSRAQCFCATSSPLTCTEESGKMIVSVGSGHDPNSCLAGVADTYPGADAYIDEASAVEKICVELVGETTVDILIQRGGKNPQDDVTPPVITLADNGVERTSDATATIRFTSSEAGTVYYSLVSADAVDTSATGTTMVSGDNTLDIVGLTTGEAKVYIKAKDASGNVTESVLEVTVPAYVPTYEVLLTSITPAMYNQGYRYVSATAAGLPLKSNDDPYMCIYKGAQAGQTVKVTLLIPEADKELESISLTTNDGNNTPIDVTVDGTENSFSFTMPAANVRVDSFTIKDSVVVRYNLKADVSLLYENLEDLAGNRQGTVTFTDADRVTLVQAKPRQQVTVTADPKPYTAGDMFKREFVRWKVIDGIEVSPEDQMKPSFTFEMPENDVYLFAEFKNVGTEITWGTKIDNVIGNVTRVSLSGVASERSPFTFAEGAELGAVPLGEDWWYRYEFTGWTVTRDEEVLTDVDTSQLVSDDRPEGTFGYATWAHFSVSGKKMTVMANFHERTFAGVTVEASPATMGSAAVSVGGDPTTNIPVVYEGQTVTLTATPGERYMLKGWEVKDADNKDVTYKVVEDVVNVATFTMPATGKDITAKAIFEVDPNNASTACVLEDVELAIPSATVSREGSKITITLPAGTDTSKLADAMLKFTVSKYADIIRAGDDAAWPAAGKACGMELDKAVTFTVRSEKNLIGKDETAKADYKVTITVAKSSAKDITAVKLLNADKSVIAEGKLNGTTWTITLPPDTDKALINKIGTSTDVFMQINYTGVSLAQAEGYDDATGIIGKWSSGNVMCGISPNSSKTFTVTAEDDSTKTYTVEIKYTAPNAPTLSGGSATRSSKTAATVKFTSSEAGNYFYQVVDHGAAVPTVDTSKSGTSAVKGENTITLSNLTEDARDIYIVVKNASGGESAALKVEIPAYGSGSETPDTGKFTITINAPKGGTITTNRTKADKGDEIIVTVKPDSGYQMVEGSLTYSLAVAGGETVKITGNRFIMPAGNVTITCKWETATTTAKGITSFSINGVAGAVNNSTNTITITMPRGTDVTKLTPVIATNGVKSLTPGNGETVNFTNAVTYTVAMEDGSSKTYTVTVYVDKGTLADQFWDKLTDFANQVPWWQYAEKQQSTSKYPKYW